MIPFSPTLDCRRRNEEVNLLNPDVRFFVCLFVCLLACFVCLVFCCCCCCCFVLFVVVVVVLGFFA